MLFKPWVAFLFSCVCVAFLQGESNENQHFPFFRNPHPLEIKKMNRKCTPVAIWPCFPPPSTATLFLTIVWAHLFENPPLICVFNITSGLSPRRFYSHFVDSFELSRSQLGTNHNSFVAPICKFAICTSPKLTKPFGWPTPCTRHIIQVQAWKMNHWFATQERGSGFPIFFS